VCTRAWDGEGRRAPDRARRFGFEHHRDAVGHLGDDAKVVRDEEERQVVARFQLSKQLQDLRLDRDVERRCRLVGDDERWPAGERDGDHHALPHSAGQLMRVVADAPRRIGNPDRLEQLLGARPRFGARGLAVHDERFGDLVADAHHRVQRRHRLLEDQRDARAAHSRISRSVSVSRSRPWNVTLPPVIRPGGCSRRRIENAVTDLPLPDSPTRPSVSPALI